MSYLFLLFDVRADPVNVVPWGALILLLVIVFILAVGFTAGMVALLVWLKRSRKAKEADPANHDRFVLKSDI
jgi:hypothetical protein